MPADGPLALTQDGGSPHLLRREPNLKTATWSKNISSYSIPHW